MSAAARVRRPVVAVMAGTAVAATIAASPLAGADASGHAVPAGGRAAPSIVRLTSQHGATVTQRFFGMHATNLAAAFPQAPVGAVNLSTNYVYWPYIETSKGHFDFTKLDALVARARKHGARPLLVLGETPRFYSTNRKSPTITSVPKMTAWIRYVRKVVKRYRNRLDYELWPEPNVPNNWTGTPRQLAKRVVVAAKIVRHHAPNSAVVGPAMVLRLRFERTFMKNFFKLKVHGVPVADHLDAIGVDPYPNPRVEDTPEEMLRLLKKAHHILKADHVTTPVWTVEVNYGVPLGGVGLAHHSSGQYQASYVARTYVLSAAEGLQRVYWLGWGRYPRLDIQMVTGDAEGTPSAAGRAFAQVRRWLLGQHARGCVMEQKTGVYRCTFIRAGRESWVYWVASGRATIEARDGARHAQTLDGDTVSVRPGTRLQVTRTPIRVYH